jgi:hypothetical protein
MLCRRSSSFRCSITIWGRYGFIGGQRPVRGTTLANESPPLLVSVSGKRNFAGQRQRRRKGPSHSTDRQQRQNPRTKTHRFGAICTNTGKSLSPIRRYLHDTGKSLFVWDCMVADAVAVEPVSQVEFPANREINREFANSVRYSRAALPVHAMIPLA